MTTWTIDADVLKAARKLAKNKPGRKNLRKFWKEVGLLGRMARSVAKGEYELETPQMVALVSGLAYVVSPIDAIPDFTPILGWTDDVGVVAMTVSVLGHELVQYREWERQKRR